MLWLPALASLLLHALPLAAFTIDLEDEKKRERPITVRTLVDEDFVFRPVAEGSNGLACVAPYQGVGLRHGFTGTVYEVQVGGPAWRAGVRKGDQLGAFYYEGDFFVFEVTSSGAVRKLRLKMERICQDRA